MFERTDIVESIYEGLVELSNKYYTSEYATCYGNSRKKRGEAASSHTYSAMSDSAGKSRNIYLDHPMGESKICLIHGPGHSSDECKVLGAFGSKYVKSNIPRTTRTITYQERNSTYRKRIILLLIVQWL